MPYQRIATTIKLATVFHVVMAVSSISAYGQARFEGQYEITMTQVPIGHLTWHVVFEDDFYKASADGKASRILSVLMNGEGSVFTNGRIENGQMAPTYFTSNITDEDGKTELQVFFTDGVANDSIIQAPQKRHNLVPVTDAERRGAIDPLSAMLIPTTAHNGDLEPDNCNHTLMIFDGQRRYNFALTYKRLDKVKVERGYSGPVLVCNAILQPIGGYRTDSLVVKYIAGRRDIEFWFAPISNISIMAPIRILVPTAIGTLKLQAEQFDTITNPASHMPTLSNGSSE